MNILLTNDDGFEAPGLLAAYRALTSLGTVHVVAPSAERSACGHMITLRGPIRVQRVTHPGLGLIHAVEGTPADCVRLGAVELIDGTVDLVVSGINRGANAGVDVFYSGTVAGAREGAILGIKSIALSCAVRTEPQIDWLAATDVTTWMVDDLMHDDLPGPGFWNVNLPTPIPDEPRSHVHRVPMATQPTPMKFDRVECDDGKTMEFHYGAAFWSREVPSPTDYSVMRDGGIAITAIPLAGSF